MFLASANLLFYHLPYMHILGMPCSGKPNNVLNDAVVPYLHQHPLSLAGVLFPRGVLFKYKPTSPRSTPLSTFGGLSVSTSLYTCLVAQRPSIQQLGAAPKLTSQS